MEIEIKRRRSRRALWDRDYYNRMDWYCTVLRRGTTYMIEERKKERKRKKRKKNDAGRMLYVNIFYYIFNETVLNIYIII